MGVYTTKKWRLILPLVQYCLQLSENSLETTLSWDNLRSYSNYGIPVVPVQKPE